MLSSNTSATSDSATYVEDVFSTYLYTGNGTSQTITNNIDLSTKGGLVWLKDRGDGTSYHALYDTARTLSYRLSTNTTNAQSFVPGVDAYYSNGFNLGSTYNANGNNFVSWTFRKQPKFFDVVTYTGTGVARTVAHNLGSVPGCIIVKRTSASGQDWAVYHRSIGNTKRMNLNLTDTGNVSAFCWNNTDPTSTDFTVGTILDVNGNGSTYVAYLFAHDAGGFGLTGTDNVISCGSYTGNGSTTGPTVTLGYEPQWLLIKNATTTGNEWHIFDNMRGISTGGVDPWLEPNSSLAEQGTDNMLSVLATGFQPTINSPRINSSGDTYIYIAIRRGPMKVPTDGTKVFSPIAQNSNGTVTTNFPVDMVIAAQRNKAAYTDNFAFSRLDGNKSYLLTNSNAAEATGGTDNLGFANSTGYVDSFFIAGAYPFSYWNFRRAAGFFDVVCATGTANGYLDRLNHNLGVAPEMIISKMRSGVTEDWYVYYKLANGGTNPQNYYMRLNLTHGTNLSANVFGAITPDATTFAFYMNNGKNYVHYLFASCPGVSKIGLYTGNGSSQTINCGFAAGARFILIKRAENGSTGDWYVWDTARGIVAGNDGHISLNSTAAEVTTDDSIDTDSSGFIVNQLAATNVNVNAATYIYLAIA